MLDEVDTWLIIVCLYIDITAKLAERGTSSVEGKSHLEKNCGDHKKADAEKNNCQCACHNKSDTTKATSAGGPAIIDLTHSHCKRKSEPGTSAADHGKQLRISFFFIFFGQFYTFLQHPSDLFNTNRFFLPYFAIHFYD